MKSKFASKYQERIRDIKASNETRLENIKLYEQTGSLYNVKKIKEEEGKHETARKKEKVKTPKAPKKQARRAKH